MKIYFYPKKEPRKRDGKFPVMGRLVYGDKRMQFSTQLFLSEDMLSYVSGEKWRTRKTKDMLALKRVYDVMYMLYLRMYQARIDIDLESMISELKRIQKDQPVWWKAMG